MEGGVGVPGHPDAPEDDEGEQQQEEKAAHHAQLLSAHGEDEVGVPGGERAGGGLGHAPLKIALAEDLSGADGQDRAGLLEAHPQGLKAVVKEHPDALDEIHAVPGGCVGQDKDPQYHKCNHQCSAHQHEPAQLYPCTPGHNGENHGIDHAHTHVAAHGGDEPQHKGGVSADLEDRKD